MRRGILILGILAAMLLASCSQQASSGQNMTEGATFGDTLMVNYVGKFENGTVFDTNIEEIATEAGIQKQAYNPLEVEIGSGQVISGFENALIGMEVGDKKTVTLPPEEAYGKRSAGSSLVLNVERDVPRMITLQRNVQVPEQQLNQLPGDHEVGEKVEVGDIEYEIEAIENGTAQLRIDVDEGDKIQLPNTFWNSTVIEISRDEYIVRQDPENGSIMNTQFGPIRIIVGEESLTRILLIEKGGMIQTQNGAGRVTQRNDTKVTVDFNHPLAGQTLIFDIEVVGEN